MAGKIHLLYMIATCKLAQGSVNGLAYEVVILILIGSSVTWLRKKFRRQMGKVLKAEEVQIA